MNFDIANQFNQHFTTIGPTSDDPTKYIHNSPANSVGATVIRLI